MLLHLLKTIFLLKQVLHHESSQSPSVSLAFFEKDVMVSRIITPACNILGFTIRYGVKPSLMQSTKQLLHISNHIREPLAIMQPKQPKSALNKKNKKIKIAWHFNTEKPGVSSTKGYSFH